MTLAILAAAAQQGATLDWSKVIAVAIVPVGLNVAGIAWAVKCPERISSNYLAKCNRTKAKIQSEHVGDVLVDVTLDAIRRTQLLPDDIDPRSTVTKYFYNADLLATLGSLAAAQSDVASIDRHLVVAPKRCRRSIAALIVALLFWVALALRIGWQEQPNPVPGWIVAVAFGVFAVAEVLGSLLLYGSQQCQNELAGLVAKYE